MSGIAAKRICVLTATRAEYGLLKPVILRLIKDGFDIRVVATGMHLSPEFGLTYREIEDDGITIDEKIEILLDSNTPAAISKSMGLALMGFADYFARLKPDLLLVLGDRYETLAVCCVAMNQRIPIAHMHGGETTQGAIDEGIRHAISKLSHLHFTSTEQYRNRVVQLGEQPDKAFMVGATGIENILNEPLLTKRELEQSIGFSLDKPYAVVTFHPVTLEEDTAEQFQQILDVCASHQDMKFIFTKANADANGRVINRKIDDYVREHEHAVAFSSLGMRRYLTAVKFSSMVIGNSSSGIIEVPSLGVPTINIGDRQKGRIQADSVINCQPIYSEIQAAMSFALSDEIKERVKNIINPYGDGHTSGKIVAELKKFLSQGKIDLKKQFYDIKP